MKKKKTQRRLPRPLYRGSARQRGVLWKTLRKKKQEKKRRRHKAQHAKTTNQPPKDLHTLSLYRGRKHGRKNREVRTTRHACHAFLLHVYRTSYSTMPTNDENQPRYDTPQQPHTASTHTHTHGSHTAHDPPHATHTNTKGHTAHTHTPRPRRRAPRAPTTTTRGQGATLGREVRHTQTYVAHIGVW